MRLSAKNKVIRGIHSSTVIASTVALILLVTYNQIQAQTYNATRVDGRPTGVLHDTGGSDPIIDVNTFADVGASGSNNINGPSIIRVPDWLSDSDKVNPNANYYMYFAHHKGDSMRLAWAESLTSQWHLFNYGSAPSRAWGSGGNNGSQTPGEGVLDLDLGASDTLDLGNGFQFGSHIASPDVFVDDVNQRIAMYFHAPNQGSGPSGQKTFIATSSDGLNFNVPSEGGQTGHGVREALLGNSYFRTFEVGGRAFSYSNSAKLFRAPALNDGGQVNTIANADTEGGLWNPSPNSTNAWWEEISTSDNPIQQLYSDNGQGVNDPRHFAIYSRTHRDPTDTNLYVYYSSRFDTPERIFLSVIDTATGSTDPADWTAIGQREILRPELDWEGIDQPLGTSSGGQAVNVRQLRDPFVFEDTLGTPDPSDDRLYLFYTGEGEEAIGMAELFFDSLTPNTASPQGDLFPFTPLAADFNLDAVIDVLDYTILLNALHTDVSGLTLEQAAALGDLNADLNINFADYVLFDQAYDDFNGPGAFAAFATAVPEPSCLSLLAIAAAFSMTPVSSRRFRAAKKRFASAGGNVPWARIPSDDTMHGQ